MNTLSRIPVKFEHDKLLSRLHIEPGSQDANDLAALIELVSKSANPKAVFDVCYVGARTDDTVAIAESVFTSRTLRVNLDKVERLFPFVATCGAEFDRISIPNNDIVQQYWLDELKATALRAAHDHLFSHLKKTFGLHKVTSMSPGSGDLEVWPIEQQKILFTLLGDVEAAAGVHLTDSCLMIPNKTISGIAYPAKITFETCRLCHRQNCPGRLAPLDERLYENINKHEVDS